MNLFDPKTGRFYHARISDKEQINSGSYGIIFIKESSDGTIWIISDQPGKIFKITPPELFPAQSDFTNLVEAGKPARQTNSRADFKFDSHSIGFKDSEAIYRFGRQHPQLKDISNSISFYKLLEDTQHRFWAVGQDSIVCWKKEHIKTITFPRGALTSANQFSDGTIAICNQKYAWLFKPDELLKQDSLTVQMPT